MTTVVDTSILSPQYGLFRRMVRLTKLALVALSGTLLLTGVACQEGQVAEPTPTPTPTHTPETTGGISSLYVQEAESGTFESNGDETYTLTLHDVVPYTTCFSDKSSAIAGLYLMREFIDTFDWEIPPNAAVVLKEADESEDTLIVQLFSPDYDAATQTLSYTVSIIENYTADALGHFLANKDASIPQSFGAASLFIDSYHYDYYKLKGISSCPFCNLTGADLTGADLAGADLTGADLIEAVLTDADLRDADLRGAHLIGADLRGAVLVNANLTDAVFTFADLTDADLTDADLTDAFLYCARLISADLRRVVLTRADLRGADLCDTECDGWITEGVIIDEHTKCPP